MKIINPRRNYDDPAYFPLYAVAERRNLVCLFHTGIVGGMIDYLQFPPNSLNAGSRAVARHGGPSALRPEAEVDSWYGAGRMQPIFLDGISVAFPELQIIGAHLGYGLYDSAAAVARWRRNVYFDISGGTVVRRHLMERRMLRSEVSTLKLVWGSDCDMAHMSRELTNWMQAFDEIGLSAAGAGPDLLGHRRAHLRNRGLVGQPRVVCGFCESPLICDDRGRDARVDACEVRVTLPVTVGVTRRDWRGAWQGAGAAAAGGYSGSAKVARFW